MKPNEKMLFGNIFDDKKIIPTYIERFAEDVIAKLIKNGNGTAEVTTVAGGKLWIMMKGKNVIAHLVTGDLIGDIYNLIYQNGSNYSFIAQTDIEVYAIGKDEMIQYVKKNPGVYMKMNPVYS